MEWVNSILEITKRRVKAIDDKTLCGEKQKRVKSPIQMVRDWANENNLFLGQVRVNDKSNEITAIQELLDKLMIPGNIITIDAMGTQTDIVEKIIKKESDYILTVKENKKQLLQEIIDEFKFSKEKQVITNIDIGHVRIETRKCCSKLFRPFKNSTKSAKKRRKQRNKELLVKDLKQDEMKTTC